MIMRWISDVPSKIVKLLDVRAVPRVNALSTLAIGIATSSFTGAAVPPREAAGRMALHDGRHPAGVGRSRTWRMELRIDEYGVKTRCLFRTERVRAGC
jgi:hypothetical protein